MVVSREKIVPAEFGVCDVDALFDELVDFGGFGFVFLLGGGAADVCGEFGGADEEVFDLLKGGEGDLAALKAVDGVAVELLVLLLLGAEIQDALHGRGIVAGGIDPLPGAELNEGFVLLAAEGLQAAEQCVWKVIEGNSHDSSVVSRLRGG